MAKIHQVALTLLLPFSFAAAQQTIILNDGTQFQGKFAGGTASQVTFVDQNGSRHRFYVNDIQSLTFNGNPRYNSANNRGSNNNNGYRNDAGYRDGYDSNNRANHDYRNQNSRAYATLPPDTQISVRTNENINTHESQPGRTYSASIDRDVVGPDGNVVIPRGSDAQLVVRDTGNNQVVLDLQSVNVNGQRYTLDTQDVTQRSGSNRGLGANKRTGEYVGGGAALGTLLGAIGGGGKGALIGALAGAVGGGTLQVLTRGSEVRVPAETVLNFRLDQPVYLYR
jgi:hypothetical protein